jgi:hypothetical protein
MAIGKHELELERLRIRAKIIGKVIDLLKLLLQLVAGLAFTWMFLSCLKSLIAANPQRLKELAGVITSMKLHLILPWILAGGTGIGWAYERTGKKRAIKKLGAKRNKDEQNDPYAGSSGLNATGDTPADEETEE